MFLGHLGKLELLESAFMFQVASFCNIEEELPTEACKLSLQSVGGLGSSGVIGARGLCLLVAQAGSAAGVADLTLCVSICACARCKAWCFFESRLPISQ